MATISATILKEYPPDDPHPGQPDYPAGRDRPVGLSRSVASVACTISDDHSGGNCPDRYLDGGAIPTLACTMMQGWAMLLTCCVLLACAEGMPNPSARPVVRALDGASASLTIIACPPNDLRAMAVGELIQILTQHEELVIASGGASSRLSINACPGGIPVPLQPA